MVLQIARYTSSSFFHFIYLFEREKRDSEREHKPGGEGEAGSSLIREPDVELDPRTLGS